MKAIKLLGLTPLLLLAACEVASDSPLGSELDDRDEMEVRTLIIEPDGSWADSGYYGYGNTDGWITLAVGRTGDTIVRNLIGFNLDQLPSEVTADSLYRAQLEFHYARGYNIANWRPISRGDLTVSVHPITREWQADKADWIRRLEDNFWHDGGGDFGPAMASFYLDDIETGTAEKRYVDITELVSHWLSDPEGYHGLLLKAEDEHWADCVKEFYSDDLMARENRPHLVVVYEGRGGEKREARIVSGKSCTIAHNLNDGGGDHSYGRAPQLELATAFGSSQRLLFNFDLSALPEEATINLAQLELYTVFPGRGYQHELALHQLAEGFDEETTQAELRRVKPKYEGSYRWPVSSQPAGRYNFQIARLIQDWITGTYPQHGIQIRLHEEADFAAPVVVYTSNHDDPERRPRLVIKYTLPPEHWGTSE